MSELLKKDARYIWHPFTQHATERDPVAIKSGKGIYLYDENGKEIMDLISSWWTTIHGHSHPEINQALMEQAETLEHVMFAGFAHEPAANLAEKLAAHLPGDLNRSFFSGDGSSAVEVALKLAYQYWLNKGDTKRHLFISFDGAYHGDTFGAMSVGKGCGFFAPFEDLFFDVKNIPYPYMWDGCNDIEEREQAALSAYQKILNDHAHETVALIIEPLMQGAAGIRFSRPEFVRKISEMAQEAGILVIYDEVAVGFGRTGSLFACLKIGFTPDLITMSKGLTAGYLGMAITVATDRLFNAFKDTSFKKAFPHGHTFTANPLACAVALKSLEIFERDHVMTDIERIEKQHQSVLPDLDNHPGAYMPRVMGPVLAFNLAPERGGYKTADSETLRDWYLNNGFNIRPLGNAVYILPPYCITNEELEKAYDGLLNGLNQLQRKAA